MTQFWVYVDIFPVRTWLVCAAMIAALAVGFYLISRSGCYDFGDSEDFTLFDSVAMNGLMVLQIDYAAIALRSLSSKVLFMFAAFMSYLVFTYYTCDLTARMTSGPPPFSIR